MENEIFSVRSSSHRKEDKSKRQFEELMDPWYVQGWTTKDYGIDCVVEITSPILNSDDCRTESKYFFVQLKSTESIKVNNDSISFQIPVRKINQWYSSNVPVLFVLIDLKNNESYYLWIDDQLINELDKKNADWISQKSIVVKIPTKNKLLEEAKSSLKEFIQNWKVPTRKIIEPGKFFEFKKRAIELVDAYSTIAHNFRFQSIDQSVQVLKKDVEESIYRISITGPSRVGKSSLINTLLKKEVSPTGFFQTTGVPIQVLPGVKDEVKIVFKNGQVADHKFSFEIIKEYASQDNNEDNHKAVKIISIFVSNRKLDKGVSLYDIPGLDDPDDEIINYTWQTVIRSNAIIYLIDASPAEHGGFIFKNEYKKQLNQLCQPLDKIFLVFNKVDTLSKENLERLKERVVKDLKKLNLYDKVGSKIFFISTTNRKGTSTYDSIDKLEEEIWSYILKENKYGLYRLSIINRDIYNSLISFNDILNTRLLNDESRRKLENSISKVKVKIPELSSHYENQKRQIKKTILNSVENRKNKILLQLENSLKAISIDKNLPDTRFIKAFLSNGLHQTLENSNKEYANHLNQLKEYIDRWIEDNLQDVREIISGKNEQKVVDFSDVENFIAPDIDLSSSWGMGALGFVAGLFINPVAAIGGALVGFFGNLIMSAESRRAKRITKIMDESRKAYSKTFKNIKEGYIELIDDHTKIVEGYVNNKLNLYFDDLQKQMLKLDVPINDLELEQYHNAIKDVVALHQQLQQLDMELKGYYSAI